MTVLVMYLESFNQKSKHIWSCSAVLVCKLKAAKFLEIMKQKMTNSFWQAFTPNGRINLSKPNYTGLQKPSITESINIL